MSYYPLMFDGQPLSTFEPLGVGENSVRGESYMDLDEYVDTHLRSALSDVPLKFDSFDQVRSFVEQQRPIKVAMTDASYPVLPSQQRVWIQAIMVAFQNIANVTDGEGLQKQWKTMLVKEPIKVELAAWKILKLIMIYHNLEGRLELICNETGRYEKYHSFAEHMNFVLEQLTEKKTVCRHFATDVWSLQFIDDPEKHSLRVVNNRKINDAKKRKIDTAIQGAIDQLAQNGRGVPNTNAQDREAARNDSSNVKRKNDTKSAPRKKSTRSKAKPKSKKVSNKRKADQLDEEDESTSYEPSSTRGLEASSILLHRPENANSNAFPSQNLSYMVANAGNVNREQNFNFNPLARRSNSAGTLGQRRGFNGFITPINQIAAGRGLYINTDGGAYGVHGNTFEFSEYGNENISSTSPYHHRLPNIATAAMYPMVSSSPTGYLLSSTATHHSISPEYQRSLRNIDACLSGINQNDQSGPRYPARTGPGMHINDAVSDDSQDA